MERKNSRKASNSKRESFDNSIALYDEKIAEAKHAFEVIKNNDSVSIGDDKSINSLIDDCYKLLADASLICNNFFDNSKEDFLETFNIISTKRSELSTLKDSINFVLTYKWREEIVRQIDNNNNLQRNIESFNEDNQHLALSVQDLTEKSKNTLAKVVASQKTAEDFSNRVITISTLLISLMAVIFGNISLFAESKLSWHSVLIINASILLATCVIYTIIENMHMFSLKMLCDDKDQTRITKHQKVFNIFMAIVIIILSTLIAVVSWLATISS